jgi:hypothetical protein
MNPRVKASLLWGAIGALSFLVLIQGYELYAGERITFGLKLVIAGCVGALAVGSTYLAEPLLFGENKRT